MKNIDINKYKEMLFGFMPYIIIIIVVVLIRTFIATPVKVNGTSMTNTLSHGDTMILNKIDVKLNELERFDIVVIETGDTYLIKRIIGLPGEMIAYKDGNLYINGKKVKDPYYKDENTNDFDGVKIPKNSYFVMGDNRDNSIDSRIIGVINKKDILGTTKLVIFPFKNIGIVK